MKQFETFCKRCGKKIIMTYSNRSKRWIPCDPEIFRFKRDGGSFPYVDPEGNMCLGTRITGEQANSFDEFGYQRHRVDCFAARRTAV